MLLSLLENFASTNKDVNWEYFEDLTCTAIKYLIPTPDCVQQNHIELITILWNTCIR